jgi:hypothetical protein
MTDLHELRKERDRYAELAQIEAVKARPLLREVESILSMEQRRERWVALGMHLGVGFLFFVLGVALSDQLRTWLNHVWSVLSR